MLEDLLLLRLWAAPDAERGEVRSKVSADLRPLIGEAAREAVGWPAFFAAATERLAEAGCLTTSGRGGARLILSDAGRTRVRSVFRIAADQPAGKARRGRTPGWAWWRDRHALPLALGGNGAGTADELRSALLCRFYLPEWSPSPGRNDLKTVVDLLLAKRLKVGRTSPGAFRQAVLREWVASDPEDENDQPSQATTAAGGTAGGSGRLPDALPVLAEQTRLAARRARDGRFGDKVFIAHVWRGLLAAGQSAPEEEDEFKTRLVRANTAGLLRLSRADLAGAHDPADVRDSEICYLGETFHFVRLD